MEPTKLQGDWREGSKAAVMGSAAIQQATKQGIVPLPSPSANSVNGAAAGMVR